jgi:hypothetical protein
MDMIIQENKKKISKCAYCKKQSTEINTDLHKVIFVCNDHFEAGVDKIIPNDIPGVDHVIYPNGYYIGDKLDPNVGGLAPRGLKVK